MTAHSVLACDSTKNAVSQIEHDRLPGHITQFPEGKRVIQWESDNKGIPISLYENPLPTVYHWI